MEDPDSKSIYQRPTRCITDELLPEIFEMIFCKLSLQEMLMVVPSVCKSWQKIMEGPHFWQEINIKKWSDETIPEKVDLMIQILVSRSRGTIRKLCVSKLFMDYVFTVIAHNANSLETLRLFNSSMSNEVVLQNAENFRCLTTLDLCNCWRIRDGALKAIGKNCPHLSSLRRIVTSIYNEIGINPKEEARAIADTMPNLKCLEIGYEDMGETMMTMIENIDIIGIIEWCQNLEFLDMTACCDVSFDPKFFERNYPRLKIKMISFRSNLWENHFDTDNSDLDNFDFNYFDDDSDPDNFDDDSDPDNFDDDSDYFDYYSEYDNFDDYSDHENINGLSDFDNFDDDFDLDDFDDYFDYDNFEDYFDYDNFDDYFDTDNSDDYSDTENSNEESVFFVDEEGRIHLHL